MHNERPLWGISTGLACPEMPLDQAVRSLLSHKPEVIELCPGLTTPDYAQIQELKRIQEGEGLKYTVHTADSFRPRDHIKGGVQWFRSKTRPAIETAKQIDSLWIVQHPPITDPGGVTLGEQRHFMGLLNEFRKPVLLETGVIRRDRKTQQLVEIEDGSDPAQLNLFMSEPVIGAVADVPKMSRWDEPYHLGRRSKDSITTYFERAQLFGLPIKEMHITGVEFWEQDLEFDQHALEQARLQNINPEVVMIESTPGRLAAVIGLVRDTVKNW